MKIEISLKIWINFLQLLNTIFDLSQRFKDIVFLDLRIQKMTTSWILLFKMEKIMRFLSSIWKIYNHWVQLQYSKPNIDYNKLQSDLLKRRFSPKENPLL